MVPLRLGKRDVQHTIWGWGVRRSEDVAQADRDPGTLRSKGRAVPCINPGLPLPVQGQGVLAAPHSTPPHPRHTSPLQGVCLSRRCMHEWDPNGLPCAPPPPQGRAAGAERWGVGWRGPRRARWAVAWAGKLKARACRGEGSGLCRGVWRLVQGVGGGGGPVPTCPNVCAHPPGVGVTGGVGGPGRQRAHYRASGNAPKGLPTWGPAGARAV